MTYLHDKGHNHTLADTATAAMVTSAGRAIPGEFNELGELLAASGLSAKHIMQVFVTKAQRDGVEQTFLYQDVYNKFVRSRTTLDASGFASMLIAREGSAHAGIALRHFIQTDANNHITRTFVELQGAREIWGSSRAKFKVSNVLLFDPTFGTNKFGLKLSMFITVDGEGNSFVLAYVVHESEDEADIEWALKCFVEVFKTKPSAFFTDSGSGLLAAVRVFTSAGQPWEGVKHLLCIYHIYKNFFSHIHPLFAGNPDAWREASNVFWLLAKRADYSDQQVMSRINELVALLKSKGSGSTKVNAIKWLESTLGGVRVRQWAASYTWSIFTAGAHSTQRAEGIHAAVKNYTHANHSLLELHEVLSTYSSQRELRNTVETERRMVRSIARNSLSTMPPFVYGIFGVVSTYAYEKFCSQMTLAIGYSVSVSLLTDDHDDDQATFSVSLPTGNVNDERAMLDTLRNQADGRLATGEGCMFDFGVRDHGGARITTVNSCNCKYTMCHGIPCRHILAVRLNQAHTIRGNSPEAFEAAGWWPLVQLFNVRWVVKFPVDIYCRYTLDDEHTALSTTFSRSINQYGGSNGDGDSGGTGLAEAGASACYKSLLNAVRKANVVPESIPDSASFDITAYDSQLICVKWGSANQGSWHVGQICFDESTSAPMECKVKYLWSDNSEVCHTFGFDKLCSQIFPGQRHPKLTWFMCKPRPSLTAAHTAVTSSTGVGSSGGQIECGTKI